MKQIQTNEKTPYCFRRRKLRQEEQLDLDEMMVDAIPYFIPKVVAHRFCLVDKMMMDFYFVGYYYGKKVTEKIAELYQCENCGTTYTRIL